MWSVVHFLFFTFMCHNIYPFGYAQSASEPNYSAVARQTTIVPQDEFPYQVSLHTSFNDDFFCGGIAVSNTTVLTVGQCLYYDWGGQMPPLIVRVYIGRNSLNAVPLFKFEVSQILYHPKFNKMEADNNLALLKINTESAAKNSSIILDHISLAESLSASANRSENCTVVGWNKETKDLIAVEVNVVNCSRGSSKTICVQSVDANSTVCNVSLGTSLICDDRLAGILTMQSYCNTSTPYTIFENVMPVKDWLLKNGAECQASFNMISIWLCPAAFHFMTRKFLTT